VSLARIAILPLIAAVALLAAGCGKSSKPETATEWASGFCSSATTWKDSVNSAISPLKQGNVTKDSVQTAFNDFKSATDTFTKDVKNLGKPPIQAGDQAKSDIDQLSSNIDAQVKTIQDAVKNVSSVSTALTIVPTVTTALTTMRTDVQMTFSQLKQLDAKGELTTAFQNSQSCKTLTASASS
jgi:hypothetical protein